VGVTPKKQEFWTERGIDPAVRDARPYTHYYEDDVTPVQKAYKGLKNAGQRANVTRKAKAETDEGGVRKRVEGIIIHRHAVYPELPEVLPELRPDTAISTATPKRHWHGYGDPPADDRYYERLNPDSEPGIAHRNKHHGGGNIEEVHDTRSPGKYHFAPNGKRDVTYEHDHAEAYGGPDIRIRSKYSTYMSKAERWERHVASKAHNGEDVVGLHKHTVRRPDPDDNNAKRLDIHPWASLLLNGAQEIFYGIEGCLKADAVLSAILQEQRMASVFSVPSVTLWDPEEMPDFAQDELIGKRVVIVPDADWVENPRVIEQARLCRTYLRRMGVEDTLVAAPPHHIKDEEGKVKYKGVDDWLGSEEGSLDGLLVQHRVINEWAIKGFLYPLHLSKPRRARAHEMLVALAEHAGAGGTFYGTLARFAEVLGVERVRVGRAIKDLCELDAITLTGSLEIREHYFLRGFGWGPDNPAIILREDLRGYDWEETLGTTNSRLGLRTKEVGF
jgi:hypothetical protein